MDWSLFGYVYIILISISPLAYCTNIFHPTYALQPSNQNQLSIGADVVQEQEADRASLLNESDGDKADPADLGLEGSTLTPELVSKELTNSNSSEIADYPLQELSADDIMAAFNLISDATLEKVLTNITSENLNTIFDKINSFYYESILERVSEKTQKHILNNTGIQLTLP